MKIPKRKLGVKPPHDPAIPLLGIYHEETEIERDTCIPLLIAALFSLTRTWKQPRFPSIDEWIKKLWYIYTMEYYSTTRKNETMPFAAKWLDLEIIILSELSQTKTYIT